jgi:hypothetical protein
MLKIQPCEIFKFCINLYYARENAPHLGRKWCISPCVILYKLIQNLQISQGYIFRILQHFATKLCNFTHFNMLFLAAVMDNGFCSSCRDQNLFYSWNHLYWFPFPKPSHEGPSLKTVPKQIEANLKTSTVRKTRHTYLLL